jgi:hypothetical protein
VSSRREATAVARQLARQTRPVRPARQTSRPVVPRVVTV